MLPKEDRDVANQSGDFAARQLREALDDFRLLAFMILKAELDELVRLESPVRGFGYGRRQAVFADEHNRIEPMRE